MKVRSSRRYRSTAKVGPVPATDLTLRLINCWKAAKRQEGPNPSWQSFCGSLLQALTASELPSG
jgi:hypothetical protein